MYDALLVYYSQALFIILLYIVRCKNNWLPLFLLLIFCPFIGPVIAISMYRQRVNEENTLPDWIINANQNQVEQQSFVPIDVEKEKNNIPVIDAILLNENKVKRKLLMDLLKNNSPNNMKVLNFALQSQDSETSHYAASAILEIKRKLLNTIHKLEQELENNPNDLNKLCSYVEAIKEYTDNGFFDSITEDKYKGIYSSTLEKMIEIEPFNEEFYVKKINHDIEARRFEIAKYYGEMFLRYCPNEEDAYFMIMQLHYEMKNFEELHNVLEKLKQSTVRLSPKGLEKMRFWLGGGFYGTKV